MKLYVLVCAKGKPGEWEIRGLVREESLAKQWQIAGNGVFELEAGFGVFSGIEVKLKQWEEKR